MRMIFDLLKDTLRYQESVTTANHIPDKEEG